MVQPSRSSDKRKVILKLKATGKSTTAATKTNKSSEGTGKKAAKRYRKQSKSSTKPGSPCYFLDSLPAELRNRIYDELLDPGSLSMCHPQILGTCKQINNEASGILYGNNQFSIRISRGQILAQGVPCGDAIAKHERLDFDKLVWPPFLRKVYKLRIELNSSSYGPSYLHNSSHRQRTVHAPYAHTKRPMPLLSHILYSLCQYLSQDNRNNKAEDDRLTSLQIDMTIPEAAQHHPASCRCIASALFPLGFLDKVPSLTVAGCDPADTATLTNGLRSAKPQTGLLNKYDGDIEEAKGLQEALKLLGSEQPGYAPELEDALRNVQGRLLVSTSTFLDDTWQNGLSNAGEVLRGVLMKIRTEDVMRLLQEKSRRLNNAVNMLRNLRRGHNGGS